MYVGMVKYVVYANFVTLVKQKMWMKGYMCEI